MRQKYKEKETFSKPDMEKKKEFLPLNNNKRDESKREDAASGIHALILL